MLPPTELRSDPRVDSLRPWYHDFSRLGLDTGHAPAGFSRRAGARLMQLVGGVLPGRLGRSVHQRASALRSEAHRVNQSHKEAILVPLLEQALARLAPGSSCLDLFCADGYYSFVVASLDPTARVLGVDLADSDLERASVAGSVLRMKNVRFSQRDVPAFVAETSERFDLVLCCGGLYHLSDPRQLLAELRRVCSGLLVLQTVVSLEDEGPEYFATPAPGWSHGCRFSHARLAGWLEDLGWRIERFDRNELTGNNRPRDRGSSYFLCGAPGS